MAAACALSQRGRGRTSPNPNVGCLVVREGVVVGRGWTQPGGRPHAEAMALAEAGEKSRGATIYVTLEPCAHESARGPACADLLVAAGVAEVVVGLGDPDARTNGRGIELLRAAGISVLVGVGEADARRAMPGFLTRQALGRPFVTLKLATSLDGCIALESGESRWITGPQARRHAHVERARHEAILVGRGTFEADAPKLDVRVAGLEDRGPRRVLLSSRHPGGGRDPEPHAGSPATLDPGLRRDDGWEFLQAPEEISQLEGDHLLVEGGAQAAAAFLRADLVDRLLLYRAPILIGGKPALASLGLGSLDAAHGRWRLLDTRMLGRDRLEDYLRA